jgi:hypothetical protein
MKGLNHDFYLLDINNFSHNDYGKMHGITADVSIHDDILHYISDSQRWIRCYNPARREAHDGLCFYGPTVIRREGADAAVKVFQSWANLFSLGPVILDLRYTWSNDCENNSYASLEAPRDELVLKLSTLASFAQKIIDTNGQYFILHHGI